MSGFSKQPCRRLVIYGILLLSSFSLNTFSQKYEVDVITLRNGDIYRGIIVEQADNQVIRLNTLSHNTLNFKLSDILSVSREQLNLGRSGLNLPFKYESTGYMNITNFGLLAATGENNQNGVFSISTVNGYSFASRFFAGGGLGFELFETLMLPVYADTRLILAKRRIAPFLECKSGYSFALEDPASIWGESYDAHGGFTWGTGLGIFIWANDKNAFEINLGYRYQAIKSDRTYEWSGETTTLTKKYNRMEIRFGILFQ